MVNIKDKDKRQIVKRGGVYKRQGEKITVRLSEVQSALLTEFAAEFGLNATVSVRACMAACFGPEAWLGLDDKMSVHLAAKFLAEGGEVEGEVG